MPVLQFKGKTAVECYHHSIPHHTLARSEQETGRKVRPMLVPFNLM